MRFRVYLYIKYSYKLILDLHCQRPLNSESRRSNQKKVGTVYKEAMRDNVMYSHCIKTMLYL